MINQKPILVIDGMNFFHRARAGFNLGDYPVVFNTFRNLRAIIEKFSPNRVYVALEGHPKHRYDLLAEYKANRVIKSDDPEAQKKQAELASFHRQVDLIMGLMQHLPVSVVRHAGFEADDTIYNIIKRSPACAEWVVVSTDTDFTQLLNEFKNVRVYNPVTKSDVADPGHDYVTWKALRGDPSDNIPGLPGVGDSMASDLVNDPDGLKKLFADPTVVEQFRRNHELVKLREWSDEEAMEMTSTSPTQDWDAVGKQFDVWLFKSLLKEPAWTKFKSTFDPLWGGS